MFTWIGIAALCYLGLIFLTPRKNKRKQKRRVTFSNRSSNPKLPSESSIPHSSFSAPEHIRQDSLATINEQKLYSTLLEVLPDNYVVHCQVSLMSLVQPANYRDNSRTWAKRMDYVITDKTTKILAVIELDDSTHRWKKRQERDRYVNEVLDGHHPLIRFQTCRVYKPEMVAKKLFNEAGITSDYFSS